MCVVWHTYKTPLYGLSFSAYIFSYAKQVLKECGLERELLRVVWILQPTYYFCQKSALNSREASDYNLFQTNSLISRASS